MYKPEHFIIQELVSQDLYHKYKYRQDKLWLIFDDRLLRVADQLRNRYGSCYVNNWFWKKDLNYCGFREQGCGVGSPFSQHRFGRALDLHFNKVTAEEIRRDILAEIPFMCEFIKGVENDVSWLHIDTRNANERVWFNP